MTATRIRRNTLEPFYLRQKPSKEDDIKIKRIVSPFFLPLPLYLALTAVLSAGLHVLKTA